MSRSVLGTSRERRPALAEGAEPPPARQAGEDAPAEEVLRFGYSTTDVARLAGAAMSRHTPSMGLDAEDRREAAWFGVVELLYAAEQPPSGEELFVAATRALSRLSGEDFQARGFDTKKGRYGGPGQATRFAAYWGGWTSWAPEPAFVSAIIDTAALQQIWPELTGAERETLLALAAYEDQEQAAAALGVQAGNFRARLSSARRRALGLWHEGQTPPTSGKGWTRVPAKALRPNVAATIPRRQLPGVLIPDVLQVFHETGRERIRSRELLERLAAADPGRYGEWDQEDLAQAMRVCGVLPRKMTFGLASRGDEIRTSGYLLDDVDDALTFGAPAAMAPADPAQTVLLAWLTRERTRPTTRARAKTRASKTDVLNMVTAAGPAGITVTDILRALPNVSDATVSRWLADHVTTGALVKLARGHYAATRETATRVAA